MRLPLATTIQSRDGTLNKDSKLVNAFVETAGESSSVFRRPGTTAAFDLGANQGRGVFCWKNTFFAVAGNSLVQGPTSSLVPDGSAWEVSQSVSTGITSSNWGNALTTMSAYDAANNIIYGLSWSTTFSLKRYYILSDSGLSTGTPTGITVANFSTAPASIFFKGKIYIIEGSQIHTSVDGINYVLGTSGPAGWSGSIGLSPGVAVSGDLNTMYIVGGQDSFGSAFYSGVWETNDGVNWTEVVMPVGFTSRAGATVFHDGTALYIAGGTYGSGNWRTDVWRGVKTAGVWSWSQVETSLFTSPTNWSGAGARVNDTILLNRDGEGVFRSTDNGLSFSLATASPPFNENVSRGYSTQSQRVIGDDIYFFHVDRVTDSNDTTLKWWRATNNTPGGLTYTITGDTIPVSFTQTSGAASTEYLVLKTTAAAWVLTFGTPGTLNQITDLDFPATTVPGVAYLDGYFFVMTTAGEIYNSALEDPTSWGALDFISAEIEPDNPVALAKHQNYIVALKDTTTELFYNAANTTGSPLARTQNAALQIGCGAGYSVANVDGGLFFISKTRSTGLSVHYFAPDALVPTEVATPGVQRILSAADLTTVHCFAGRIGGHTFYVVNLVSDGITLAFDLQSRTWAQWTYLTAQAAKNVTSITQADGIATATVTAHGYADGDPVVIAGADQAGYNGTHNIRYVDANTFKFDVDSATVSPATGTITATGYDEGYFPFGFFGSCGGFDYIQHETSGEIFKIATAYSDDNGVPINWLVRTPQLDLDNRMNKVMGSLELIADQSSDTVLVRYTDDDYQTYSKFRAIPLDSERTQIRRMGKFRKRALEFRCTTDGDLRVFAADVAV